MSENLTGTPVPVLVMKNEKEFKPTYLYIKQHSITGKLYFGKTYRSHEELLKYSGSGKYWRDHVKKHGVDHVITLWYCLFYDKEECEKFALSFSTQENIAESKNWANLIPENGISSTGVSGERNGSFGRGAWGCGFKGNIPWNKGRKTGQTPWNKDKVGVQLAWNKGISAEKITCPHCSKVGGSNVMRRWHFDNCKSKPTLFL